VLGAINRDDSDEISTTQCRDRGKGSAPAALADFGGGPHRCLGSHMARMELTLIVNECEEGYRTSLTQLYAEHHLSGETRSHIRLLVALRLIGRRVTSRPVPAVESARVGARQLLLERDGAPDICRRQGRSPQPGQQLSAKNASVESCGSKVMHHA